MIEVEIGELLRHQRFVGETRTGILGGVARDVASRFDGFTNRLWIEIGGAGTALVAAEIHADAEPVILLMLDGFDLAHAGRDRQPLRHRQTGLGLGGAFFLRQRQRFRKC